MAAVAALQRQGVQHYYESKVDELEILLRDKTQNLARLTAQRNQLNGRVRLLREELHALREVSGGAILFTAHLAFGGETHEVDIHFE